MHMRKQLEHRPVQDIVASRHHENRVVYVSLIAFLAMGAVFFLILSL